MKEPLNSNPPSKQGLLSVSHFFVLSIAWGHCAYPGTIKTYLGACVVSTQDQTAETATSVLRSSPCPWYFPLPSLQSLLGLSLGRQPPLLEESKYIDSGRGREETHAHPRLLGPAVSFSTAWRQRKHREKQEQGS